MSPLPVTALASRCLGAVTGRMRSFGLCHAFSLRHFICVMSIISSVLGLLGCDQGAQSLRPGVSRVQDVRKAMGEPGWQWSNPIGSTWEYPDGPRTWMIDISKDDLVVTVRQVLDPAYFARLQPGMGTEEVLRLIGHPSRKMTFERLGETVWSWTYDEGPNTGIIFNAHFDVEGRLARTSRALPADP